MANNVNKRTVALARLRALTSAAKGESPQGYLKSWDMVRIIDDICDAIEGTSGGSGAGCSCNIVVATENTVTGALDKTWQEIRDADIAIIRIRYVDSQNNDNVFSYIAHTAETSDESFVVLYDSDAGGENTFRADSANGYPVRVEGDPLA